MRMGLSRQFLALAILLATLQVNDASIGRLFVRQSGEGEQENTTPKVQDAPQQQAPAGAQSPRLYPDLPRQPNFLPPFNAPPANSFPTGPLIPFGMQMPPQNRLNADQQPAPFGRLPPQPRPMTAAERLQSQTFANGLGRRLLSMIGIDSEKSGAQAAASTAAGPEQPDDTMRALQNSSVLQQLNQGVHSIYEGLSKMYNSTIQDQLNMLQERFKSETANTTNPWQQRMAQQVPAFFKQVAGKVEGAQEQLNRVWRDLSQANSSTLSRQGAGEEEPRNSFFGSLDHFLHNGPGGHDFFGNAFGPNNGAALQGGAPNQAANQTTNQMHEFAQKLRQMWQRQVEPELMNIRGHMSRVWRDLISNGAIVSDTFMRSRQNNLGASQNGNVSSDLVDSILKEVDVSSPEYTLIDAKGDPTTAASTAESESSSSSDASAKSEQQDMNILKLSPQMQNRVVEMQSELNRLWMGLMNSLQAATNNVKRSLNPQPQFEFMRPMESQNRQAGEADPKQNEISNRIKELSKLQRDADMVHDAVQQQQHETQQRQSIGDRFRGLFNNAVDMRQINQLPDRIGEQFNRFGNAVGNFWNHLPERWDNFMTNVRPQSGNNKPMTSSTTSTTTSNPPTER